MKNILLALALALPFSTTAHADSNDGIYQSCLQIPDLYRSTDLQRAEISQLASRISDDLDRIQVLKTRTDLTQDDISQLATLEHELTEIRANAYAKRDQVLVDLDALVDLHDICIEHYPTMYD